MNKTAALSCSMSSGTEEQGSYKVTAHAIASPQRQPKRDGAFASKT